LLRYTTQRAKAGETRNVSVARVKKPRGREGSAVRRFCLWGLELVKKKDQDRTGMEENKMRRNAIIK